MAGKDAARGMAFKGPYVPVAASLVVGWCVGMAWAGSVRCEASIPARRERAVGCGLKVLLLEKNWRGASSATAVLLKSLKTSEED